MHVIAHVLVLGWLPLAYEAEDKLKQGDWMHICIHYTLEIYLLSYSK